MDSEDGDHFIKQLATFVRTHEKALANALQFQRREVRHRPSQSTSSIPSPTTLPERPATSSSTTSLAAAFSLGPLNFTSHNIKSAKLALTPHHLFFILSRFEELGISVGPMKIRLENLHDSSSSTNYVSFLGDTQRTRSHNSDVGSIHSVSSVRSVMSGMSALWNSLGIGASISAARTERHRAVINSDLKYLYSAFTKIPCLKLAPDWRAKLISGYEEFPFDSAVPIYVFKNLQALEVNSIDFRQFFGWDRLADQLRSLSLRNAGIEDPADILIDIVLDDMDKRRRRSSKSQSSPTTTWTAAKSPRRSPASPPPELVRAASAPGAPEHKAVLAELRLGSVIPSEPVMEDGESETARSSMTRENGFPLQSPVNISRRRSISPPRPASSRNHSSHVRSSQRIQRSGSGSSQSSMSDSWHHHVRGSSGNLLTMGILPASKWRFLRHLSLADNAMTSIPPASLAPLANTLYSLDLSSNLFSQIPDSLATLTALRALNLSNCMIDSLQSLTRSPLPAITALNLRANRLQSLAGVGKLFPLERLDLRDNRLADPLEMARLTGIPEIREIWLDGNPFTRSHRNYRVTIFNLFRSAPGYTEDIVIDGRGPTYSEKRQLIDRVPIPDSVPVIKPSVPETPAVVDVSKPAIVYHSSKEPVLLRKERPIAKAVTSEVNTSSSRRRKVSKRRIVDLANGDSVSSQAPHDSHIKDDESIAGSHNLKYSVSREPAMTLLPPLILTDSRSMQQPLALATSSTPSNSTISGPSSTLSYNFRPILNEASKPNMPQDWDVSGEIYRRKIEALRDSVGSDYLSILSEESWDGNPRPFISPVVQSVAALRAGHVSHHVPQAQAIHGGRSLG